MSPGPIARLKPYFKTRPRTRPAAATAPPATPVSPASAAAVAQPQQPATAAAPTARPAAGGELERRREQLGRRYAELQSDLGGLAYEMAIRDHFRLDVLVRRAAELQAVDGELTSVEQALGIATSNAAGACPSCGTPLAAGAQFCGRCGAGVASATNASPPASPTATPATGGGTG